MTEAPTPHPLWSAPLFRHAHELTQAGAMLPGIDLTMFRLHQRFYRQSYGPIVDAEIDNRSK